MSQNSLMNARRSVCDVQWAWAGGLWSGKCFRPVADDGALDQVNHIFDDVRRVTGLTLDQIARATRVSGRAVATWNAGGVPSHRESDLQALRSIGLSMVGGLGPSGVQRWLLAGDPPRLDRFAAGDSAGVAAEARAYETSPAT